MQILCQKMKTQYIAKLKSVFKLNKWKIREKLNKNQKQNVSMEIRMERICKKIKVK